jgi:signal peptidase I
MKLGSVAKGRICDTFKFMSILSRIRTARDRWHHYKLALHARSVWQYRVVDGIETIVVALAMALLIRKFIIQASIVPSTSMVPTFLVGDRLFVNKFIYRFKTPQRGDIVVFRSVVDDKDYVKRCVGLPGETLEVRRGDIYVNGKLVILPGVNVQRDYDYMDPVKIPADSYFMMGDNRGSSSDSRYWGFVPDSHLLGKAWFTFWPLSRMQVLH